MRMIRMICSVCLCCCLYLTAICGDKVNIYFCGSERNDLYQLLKREGMAVHRFDSPAEAVGQAGKGMVVCIVADGYPATTNHISPEVLATAKQKALRLYIEYPDALSGISIDNKPVATKLERGVVTAGVFGAGLPPMSILGVNDCHVLSVKVKEPLIVLAKVAGFNKAEYGVSDVPTYPLLFKQDAGMVAMTSLSNFATGRYGPADSWKLVWEYILSDLTGKQVRFKNWPVYVAPMYSLGQKLPVSAGRTAIARGVQWFYNGHFFVDPSWKALWLENQGDGSAPFGRPLERNQPDGDGSLGILEGHASNIYYDGQQQYRYWMRADVQGEVAFAMAAAGNLLDKKAYFKVASNLGDYMFHHSNLRAGPRNNKDSASFGLIGWSVTHPYVFYGDDNARAILGLLGAAAYMKTDQWNQELLEGILANFRTTGKHGFRDGRVEEAALLKEGWRHFQERDIVNPHPHFEAWMWACYLWLYDKTGYTPLLEKTKEAIRMTMAAYPDKWSWTNGIQQERARMVLPLAWLVRVENTAEHRHWLDQVASKLLENQVPCGAIQEELGAGNGMFGRTSSNASYGLHEAPLIFDNGDPVADMLYTSNFAFFSLNEAASATGNPKYLAAVKKLADFLTRIQVKSDRYKDLDGAWFRAFDYKRWDYWASNADAGWGAWGTLTGWTQSWITATLVLTEQRQSFWELTKRSTINQDMKVTVKNMLPE
jgi:hypothetical protein